MAVFVFYKNTQPFLEETIMKVTAATESIMPIRMFAVIASLKTTAPTRMAVTGSNTPSTEVFAAPIFLVERASVVVDMIVGKTASPIMLSHANALSKPRYISISAV